MIWTLLGCSGSLSNAIFHEDAAFLAALPTYDELARPYPGAEDRTGDEALYYGATADSLEGFAQYTLLITSVADTARLVAPSYRGDDVRIWGPGAWDVYPGTYLRLEVSRTSTHELYVYQFQASESPDGPWTEFVTGSTRLDEVESGSLDWDQGALDSAIGVGGRGTYDIEYTLGEVTEIEMAATGLQIGFSDVSSSNAWLIVDPDGSGLYELHYQQDIDGGADIPIDEEIELVSRWTADGAGRGEAEVRGGDTDYPGLVFTQCWDLDGQLTFQEDSEGVLEVQGDEADCVVEALER